MDPVDPEIRAELIKNWKLINQINALYPKLLGKIPDYCRNNKKECKPLCNTCRGIQKEEEECKKLMAERDKSDAILNDKYGSRAVWAGIEVDGRKTNMIGDIADK